MTAEARSPKPPPSLRRTLVTPEGVDLGVELAPVAARFAALAVDLTILAAVAIGVLLVFALVAGGGMPGDLALILLLIGLFVLRNAWFLGWEMTARAATPGKRLMKIRVAMRNGGRLTADAVFARNVMREPELFLPLQLLLTGGAAEGPGGGWMTLMFLVWTAGLALLPAFNRDKLRAGDLIAGTWVVMAPRAALKADLSRGAVTNTGDYPFTREQLDAYGVKELHVLEDVLRTMEKAVVKDVAFRIREKIGWTAGVNETDAEFLKAYYAGLRDRLEKRMLLGHRRRDKHDRTGLR